MQKESEKDTGVVIETIEDEVLVEVQRKGSCKNCSVSMLCMGSSEKVRFKVKKPGFEVVKGDQVVLDIAPADRIISSLIIFIFPIVTMLLFYFIIRHLIGLSEDVAIFGSILSLLISAICIKHFDRMASKKVLVKISGKL